MSALSPAVSQRRASQYPEVTRAEVPTSLSTQTVNRNAMGRNSTVAREDLSVFFGFTEGDRLQPLWRVLAMTGIRRGESLALRWCDVDLDGERLTIRRSRVQVGYETLEQET